MTPPHTVVLLPLLLACCLGCYNFYVAILDRTAVRIRVPEKRSIVLGGLCVTLAFAHIYTSEIMRSGSDSLQIGIMLFGFAAVPLQVFFIHRRGRERVLRERRVRA